MMDKPGPVIFYRDRDIQSDTVVGTFRNTILSRYPGTELYLGKTIPVKAAFPGTSIITVMVYVFEAHNPEVFFNKFFCWTRRVVEYGQHRIITYTVPGYYPDNPHGLARTPEEAVEMMAKADKDYSIVKDN